MFTSCWDINEKNDPNNDYSVNINSNNYLPLSSIEDDNLEKTIIPGLSNFEGNCYLNSIMQCFYYCNDLTKYFMEHEKEIKDKKGKLSNEYLNLIIKLNKKEKYNDAKIFLNTLKEVSYNFIKKGGNDPKAVLLYFLQNLHNELKEENKNYKEEDICCEDIDKEKAFEKCKNNEEYNKSIITELFNLCIITKNKCDKCGNKHYMCEYKNHLLIELNKYESKEKIVNLDDLIKFSFEDSIRNFICNTSNEVFKAKFKKRIISFPQYLIIILNRKNIKFNVKYNNIIDISEYYINKEDKKVFKYKFVGACLTNDFENRECTHAISRCITSDGYYIFNDLFTYKNNYYIKGYNPYILFYKKYDNYI